MPVRGKPRREILLAAALLTLHAGLLVWSATSNSVTFDENFHVPAGVAVVTRGALEVSALNPPLGKALFGIAALAAGAAPPSPESIRIGEQAAVGESFMRRNASRYHSVFLAARGVVIACSLLLAMLVWRMARRLHGRAGGLIGLGFYAFAPEAIAHGSVATLDVPTALTWLACVYSFWLFARTGRSGWWWAAAGAFAAAMLVRFTAPLLVPALAAMLALLAAQRRLRRPRRAWIGLALLVPAGLLSLQIGYLGRTSLRPLHEWRFASPALQELQRRVPAARLPLPVDYVSGWDWLTTESRRGATPTFVNGQVHMRAFWWYLPYALVLKWPLAFMAALVFRGLQTARRGGEQGAFVLIAPMMLLALAMGVGQFNVGIRYVFVLVPALCVWLGGLGGSRGRASAPSRATPARRRASGWVTIGAALALLHSAESVAAAPWHLAFFNRAAGGPGGGDRRINDSNVDWGQGLIALRDEMRRLRITRVLLAYHGTTDPAVYGIDYAPFMGGPVAPEHEWFAVSSYFLAGLGSRRMLASGRAEYTVFDLSRLDRRDVVARPARCMYLLRLRRASAGGRR